MRAILLAPILLLASVTPAQLTPTPTVPPATTFDAWVRQQLIAALPQPHGSDQQKDSPAADPRSTALVDNTAAPSLLSLAAAFVPVTSNLSPGTGAASTGAGSGTGTATASLFSIIAGIRHVQPLDPDFYRSGVNARRLFFTGGSASSTQAVDNTASAASVLGAKFLIINRREIYAKRNLAALGTLESAFAEESVEKTKLLHDVRILFLQAACPGILLSDGTFDLQKCPDALAFLSDANFAITLQTTPPATLIAIRSRIAQSLDTEARFRTLLNHTYDQIAKAMQLSSSYTANIRTGAGYNTHREQIIFDYGLDPRINWTLNLSADTIDRKGLKKNSSGGRLATEFQGNLTQPPRTSRISPVTLSFGGEGNWATAKKPSYTGQVKVSIPLLAGIDLPVAYRYSNRVAQLNQSDSKALLGLSFDLSRFLPSSK